MSPLCYHTAMLQPATIAVLGGINIDLVAFTPRFPEDGESVVGSRFLTYPGGKGANQAVAAARLAQGATDADGMSIHVGMIGRVGGDDFGRQLLDSLSSNGVDVSGIGVDPESASGTAVIIIDASAQNRIVQIPGANHTCGDAEVGRVKDALGDASLLMLQLEVPMEVNLAVAREAASTGKTVILDPGPAMLLPPEFYSCCSYITPNETEAQALVGFPVTGPDSARDRGRGASTPGRRLRGYQDGRSGGLLCYSRGQPVPPCLPGAGCGHCGRRGRLQRRAGRRPGRGTRHRRGHAPGYGRRRAGSHPDRRSGLHAQPGRTGRLSVRSLGQLPARPISPLLFYAPVGHIMVSL